MQILARLFRRPLPEPKPAPQLPIYDIQYRALDWRLLDHTEQQRLIKRLTFRAENNNSGMANEFAAGKIPCYIYLAYDASNPKENEVGWILVWEGQTNRHGHFLHAMTYVRKECRRMHIGETLYKAAYAYAQQRNMEFIVYGSDSFYSKCRKDNNSKHIILWPGEL